MPHSAPATEAEKIRTQGANTYDQNADFWIGIIRGNHDRYRTGLTNSAILESLGPVNGLRILDAGCGEGYLSRELASRGASVLGVDSSHNLIEAARNLAPSGVGSAAFEVQDVTNLRLDSDSFDLIVCNHLMNDLPDPTGPIRELSRVLKPGGRLAVLMLHPCFYEDRGSRSDSKKQGPGIAYFSTRKISQKFDVNGVISPAEVTSYHRPLEFYIGSFRDADLWIIDLQEPHPTDDQMLTDPWWQASFPRPLFLLLIAQKHEPVPLSGQRQ